MRLLRVELTRFRARRAVVLLLLAAALVTALIAGTTAWNTRPISAADQAAAQLQADAEAQQPHFQRRLARCEKNPQRFMGPDATAEQCQQMLPQAEWYLFRDTLKLGRVLPSEGTGLLLLLGGVMLIIGTTFAGADWASGSMANQLLFESRRRRVWFAKAGAVLLGTAAATLVLAAAFWGALYLVAESRGIPTGATVQADIRWTVARGALLAGLGAAGAYAVTMLLPHTVGTLALMFAYAVGGEILIATVPIAGIGRFSLANNVFAWLNDGHRYWDSSLPCPGPGRGCSGSEAFLSLTGGAAYLAALVALVAVLSLRAFRRRDVP